jgi:prepilin-type N-terminal cleavage/methylation domain-containing protein
VVESRGLDVGATRARPRRRGFSILEVLVVVMVLGLLTAAMVFVVRGSRSSSFSTACAVEKTRVETAVASYQRLTGTWPPSLVTLTKEPYRLLPALPAHHLLSGTPSRVVGTGVCAT